MAAEVSTQSEASVNLTVGESIDPLEDPNYPIAMGTFAVSPVNYQEALLTLEETDSADQGIILSSNILMSNYENETFESLITDGHQTIGDLASINNPETLSTPMSLGNDTQTINVDQHQ